MSKIILYVILFAIAVMAIKWWQKQSTQQKVDNYQAIAQQTGWQIDQGNHGAFYNRHKQFKLFQRGAAKDIQAVLSGQSDMINFKLISFRHGTMTGGMPREYIILLIEDAQRRLPSLALRNKKAGYVVRNGQPLSAFGDFPALQAYMVQSEQPEQAHTVLTSNLLNSFTAATQNSHYSELEMQGAQFLYYVQTDGDGQISIQHVQQVVRQGIDIYRQLP